jgi:hypothetical protein
VSSVFIHCTCGTLEEERTLAIFERKVLRKIYGPVKESELRRVRRNDELETIIKGENMLGLSNAKEYDGLGI